VYPSISADGRYVLFLSQNRFDPSWTNNTEEMYLRDRELGTTTLVTPTALGGLSNASISFAEISPDGRYVAFQTASDNIVVPDANGFNHDVFVRDLVNETTTLISVATDGTQGNNHSFVPSISAGGRYVAFESWAGNLDGVDANNQFDVFLRDRELGTTTRLTVGLGGAETNGASGTSSISVDGSTVYFQSQASNLVSNDLNFNRDVFVHGPPATATPGFSFETAVYEVSESGGSAAITVLRAGDPCATVSVDYSASDGSATAGLDYAAVSGTLTFDLGETSLSFSVDVIEDASEEPNETVQLTLSDPSGLPLGSPATAMLTILDDDESENSPPDAVDDVAATTEDTPVVISVLANDTDPNGDALVITGVTPGAQGAVADNGNGTLTYTPGTNFNGADSFTYAIGDGRGGADTASVMVSVLAVNDAPTAAPDSYGTWQDMPLVIPQAVGVLFNDTDPDADVLVSLLETGPSHGTLALASNGSFTYTPAGGFSGADSFTYRAFDPPAAGSNTAMVTLTVQPGTAPVSRARPVTPAALHRMSSIPRDFMGEPFLVNRRLALIEDGTVPCVEVDTLEVTRCLFEIRGTSRLARASGDWLEDGEGQQWAVVGQPVTRDGTWSSGSFIVGTVADADGRVPAIGASGRDAASGAPATDLVDICYLETVGSETNASGMPLWNDVTRYVGTSTLAHPDGALQVSKDDVHGIAWYTGRGAALNDTSGQERDSSGFYYSRTTSSGCHYIPWQGVQVPAAKRPSTRSFPAPGVVDIYSRIRWLPVNPYVDIANDSPFDPRIGDRPLAHFTFSLGLNTLWVDATSSTGDILRYTWDLDWTGTPVDATGPSPTAEFPIAFQGVPPSSGRVTLTVVGRDGQKATRTERVNFRRPPRPPLPLASQGGNPQ
jgi:hypothetical protein